MPRSDRIVGMEVQVDYEPVNTAASKVRTVPGTLHRHGRGMILHTNVRMPRLGRIVVRFELPDGYRIIAVAQVRKATAEAVAIEFVSLDEEDKEAIAERGSLWQ